MMSATSLVQLRERNKTSKGAKPWGAMESLFLFFLFFLPRRRRRRRPRRRAQPLNLNNEKKNDTASSSTNDDDDDERVLTQDEAHVTLRVLEVRGALFGRKRKKEGKREKLFLSFEAHSQKEKKPRRKKTKQYKASSLFFLGRQRRPRHRGPRRPSALLQ